MKDDTKIKRYQGLSLTRRQLLQVGALGFGSLLLPGAFAACQIAVHQPDIGRQQAKRVINYVNKSLSGKANIVYYNLDWNQALKPRHMAFLDEWQKTAGPDAKIVADLNANPGSTEEGFKLTNTVLQAHPEARSLSDRNRM
jgi:hypothetical protein